MGRIKKLVRWLAIGLGVAAVLIGAGIGAASCAAEGRAKARYEVPEHEFAIPDDPESLVEGERLYHARGCAECHGERGEGRELIDAPPFELNPPNITRVGHLLTPNHWHRVVRHGVFPDGSPLFFMPAHEYRRIPDRELGAIVAHVRTFEPSDADHPPSRLTPLGNVLLALGALETMYPAELIDHAAPLNEAPEPAPTAAFGEYLADGCRGCHGANLSGGPIPGAPEDATGLPPNLTMHPTGLAEWTLSEFQTALRTGRRPDGREIDVRFMPWRSMHSYMTDTELAALWAYLGTVEPREFGNR